MDYSIEVKNLTKKFGDKLAVDNISFNVPKGKVTGFLGPNGAGKTTTMRCMLGLDNATSGEILLNGKKYINLQNPMHVVGAMIDATAFHKSRSAYNHLKFIADSIGEPKSRVDEVLEMTGLTSVAKKNAGKYSLGMGQRIGIAAALLGKPEILILDEPVNGLDPEGVKWVRDLCKGFAKSGRTVFISSHLMSEMEQTVDGLVILGRGKVLATGSLDDIKRLGGDGNESLEDAYMKLTESSVEYKTDFSAIPSLDSTSDSLALPKLQ
ncbi:MAG: ABC transporter ATP-binding protein [Candidatus Ancillula sp.]|jgi:ABC-2 type transport system ATP-binding protein|nr:ABC transporter ATP-binding protein [Candidatus Ancillula sp.]